MMLRMGRSGMGHLLGKTNLLSTGLIAAQILYCIAKAAFITFEAMIDLGGKVAVITGSTSGIGLGIARALAGAGADIMLNGFGEAAASEALRERLCAGFQVMTRYDCAQLSKPAPSRPHRDPGCTAVRSACV